MEDLYSNLENYDDVNALVELRKENEDLKRKLEEYAVNMETLQKYVLQDFDKVTLEFKRLETNYSSLLRTARAEIERKTQTIVNLNKEKDVLVLKTRQSGNRNAFHFNKRNQPFDKNKFQNKNNSDSESCKGNKEDGKETQNNLKSKTQEFLIERKDLRHTPSDETIANSNIDNTNKLINRVSESFSSSERNGDAKENIGVPKQNVKVPQACSIRNRRKSMPAARMTNAKFSSDDEDYHNNANEVNKYEFSVRKAPDRHNLIRGHLDKRSQDESPYFAQEPPRANYKTRSSRNYDSERYRSRDKYESRKSRRPYSPDRSHWKPPRDYHDNNRWPEYRQRRLETPPPNIPSESNWMHRSREHNTYREYNNRGSNWSKNNDFDDKQRSSEFMEEPISKRPRLDSNSAYHEENNHWTRERAAMSTQNVCELLQEERFGTCQSPDFMHPDLRPEHGHVPKEIRLTAITQLDDPRVSSKKYIIKSSNGETTLSTVGSKDVDIVPVDKSRWNILSTFYLPSLLRQRPSESNEENREKELNKDALLIFSLESGEIDHELNNLRATCDNIGENKSSSKAHLLTEENASNTVAKRFRIPKLKHCDTEQPQIEKNIPKKSIAYTNSEERPPSQDLPKTDDRRKSQTDIIQDRHSSTLKNILNSNVDGSSKCSHENIANNNIKHTSKCNKQSLLSNREMVEVDLELSDDNSDSTLIPQIITKKRKTREEINDQSVSGSIQIKSNVEDVNKKKQIVEQVPEKTVKSARLKEREKVEKLHSHKAEIDTKVSDISSNKKKHKEKKKPSRSKDRSTTETEAATPVSQKKRSKKEKDKPEVILNKFSDLFGDSNSLITPEDLGVHPPPVDDKLQSSNICVPFLEDAQDGIDVGNITIAQPIPFDNVVNNITSEHYTKTQPNTRDKTTVTIEDIPMSTRIAYKEQFPTEVMPKEQDIVKTVIISTGIQPQCSTDLKEPIQNPVESNGHIENVRSSVLVKNPDLHMKALATSTPHKPHNIVGAVESVSAAVPSSDLSDANTVDSQTDTDVPDVRIFVRRRRKVIKKT